MRHKVKKITIGTDKSHRKALIKNLAMSVIIHDKIKTTEAKAKQVQPFIEKLISIGKQDSLVQAIREINRLVNHEDTSKKITEVLKEKYKDRESGFTRITKLGFRKGDNAPVVQLELV